ncbi:hypothetical protein STEG23_012305 [Scotinomys teguina]
MLSSKKEEIEINIKENARVSERESALEETHGLLQQFPLDLEKFLSWITEAETTANVLQDASRKEKLLEDSKGVRELMKQWQVNDIDQWEFLLQNKENQ